MPISVFTKPRAKVKERIALDPANRRLNSAVNRTLANLDCLYAKRGLKMRCSMTFPQNIRILWCDFELTVKIRALGADRSSGCSLWVNRKGARWLTAKTVS